MANQRCAPKSLPSQQTHQFNHEGLSVFFMSQHTIIIIITRRQITKSKQNPDNTQITVGNLWHFSLWTVNKAINLSNIKVCKGAKWQKVSYYTRLYGRSVISTPRSGTATALGHRVQCSKTHCVHLQKLTLLPFSIDWVYHGAQRAQTGCVNFSTYFFGNPVCF
jgi:hypothetical protein